jgi:branched-chain amino acid transport system substrate-binding protein
MKKLTLLTAALAIGAQFGAAEAQEVSDGVVKIGILNDQSGPYADLGGKGSVVAAQMAADDFGGTVLGKKIEIVSADHQNKPDIALNIANQWIDTQNVDVIADVPTSSVALAIQDVTNQKNRIHLISGAAASDLTGAKCSPTGIHWAYDTYSLANGTGSTLVKQGGDNWFFITADYAFGHALERDTSEAVKAAGGKVVGAVRHPFPGTTDFSSFLLQAQGSGAKVVGFANAGADTINSIKQAGEFGLVSAGQRLAGLLVFLTDVHSLGLKTAQGLVITDGWYWDQDDASREWAKKFAAKHNGAMPTMVQAGVYSSIMHYLKAVDAAKTDESKAVVAKMKETPINDFFAKNGKIREDGRMVHDMLLVQVKKPEESKAPYDYYKILSVIPGDQAFRPMKPEFGCPLVK